MNANHSEFVSIFAQKLASQELVDFFFEFEDGSRFGAHSVILASQSGTLKEMIKGKSSLKVEGTSHETFKKIIQIIYCSKVKIESLEEAKELYVGGKKFNVKRARYIARKKILKNYKGQKDGLEIYDFGVLQEDKRIKEHCMNCFKDQIRMSLSVEPSASGNPFIFEIPEVDEDLKEHIRVSLENIKNKSNIERSIVLGIDLFQYLHDYAKRIGKEILNINDLEFYFDSDSNTSTIFTGKVSKTNKSNLIPKLSFTKTLNEDSETFLIKLCDGENQENELWFTLHRSILNKTCQDLLATATEPNQIEIKNMSLNTFNSIVNLMYDRHVDFSTQQEAYDFYNASKELNYKNGIILAKKYLTSIIKTSEAVQDVFEFAQANKDATLKKFCFRFFKPKIDHTIFRILYPDDSSPSSIHPMSNEKTKDVLDNFYEKIKNENKLDQKIGMAVSNFKFSLEWMLKTAKFLLRGDDLVSFWVNTQKEESEESEEEDCDCFGCRNGVHCVRK